MIILTFIACSLSFAGITVPKDISPCPALLATDGILASDGSIWVVGEKSGVYRLFPEGMDTGPWQSADYYAGFPKCRNFYAIAEDKQGRIWVGTDNQGVCVFNGESWKTYDRENALIGERIFDITVSDLTGEVAMATSAGVTIYNPQNQGWRDLTRADGLVSDQVEALSFDQDGNLLLAYACGGLSKGNARDSYGKWETVQAPWYWDKKQYVRQPVTAKGDGLPSNLCNAVLAGKNGTIWLGTNSGLAFCTDKGWKYLRGEDYLAKNQGVYGRLSYSNRKYPKGWLLPEDYVTCLAETDESLWVGFRNKGAVIFNKKTFKVKEYAELPQGEMSREMKNLPARWVSSFIPMPDGTVYATMYGRGIVRLAKGKGEYEPAGPAREANPPHPKPPEALTEESLMVEAGRLDAYGVQTADEPVIYWEEDWTTRGKWCERYGRDYAMLCGTGARPIMNNDVFSTFDDFGISVSGRIGCNRKPDDSLRHWLHWYHKPENKNVLHNPAAWCKIEGEWDDHGEAYPWTFDGPDVWAVIKLPEGVNEAALYFYNPNGLDEATAANRDYLVEVRKYQSSYPDAITMSNHWIGKEEQKLYNVDEFCCEKETAAILKEPVLCRFRVKSFAGAGVYKKMLFREPGYYFIRICKNYSFNTILNAVFVTRLLDKNGLPIENRRLFSDYAGVAPKQIPVNEKEKQQFQQSIACWDKAISPVFSVQYLSLAKKLALECYRFVHSASDHKESSLSRHWQWDLKIWSESDEHEFEETMLQSWYQKQEEYPAPYASKVFFPSCPRTIPFTPVQIQIMECMEIDWKQYLPDYQGVPKPSAKEFDELTKKMTKEEIRKLNSDYSQKLIRESLMKNNKTKT